MSEVIRLRASSISDLFDCPMRWAARNLDGKFLPSSGAAHLGTSLHASTAVFDQSILDEAPVSIDDAAGVFVDTLHNPENDVAWEYPASDAEKIGLRLHSIYCAEIAPQRDYKAVEATCESLEVDMCEGLTIELTGTTDRIRKTKKGPAISDIKSGKTRVNKEGNVNAKSDAAQLAVYELIASYSFGEEMTGTAEVIGLSTTKTGRVATIEVPNTKEILIGDENQPGLLDMAASIFRSGKYYPNNRSILCSKRYCPIFSSCKWHQ